jgi:DNA-binding NarL/FixJ family response regulator
MEERQMKILVIDNRILYRDGILNLLRSQSDMEVVGEAEIGDQAIQKAAETRPNVILLIIDRQYSEGSSLMKRILSNQPEISFLIIAQQDSDDLFFEMIGSGAKGYLIKDVTKSILLTSLRALFRGEAIIPRNRVSKILNEFVRLEKMSPQFGIEKDISLLTYRELEVLKVLTTRATNREIANLLSISENTVRAHVSKILEKLNLRNRREASALANRVSLLDSLYVNKYEE